MALSLIQSGSGGGLCVYAAPLPDVSQGSPDTTTPPAIPAATLAALGSVPCVIGVNARGGETAEQILSFARAKTGRDLWWAALIGASRGCSKVRHLWIDGAAALALVLGDGMHGARPPNQVQIGYAQSIVALARTGGLLVCILHTYIDPGPTVTSTASMARLATGWALAAPPAGETVRRVQEPIDGASRDPSAWRGGLVVYSRGSGPGDAGAHQDVLGRLLPVAIRDYVRPLVDLVDRPVVTVSGWPPASPEPAAEVEAAAPTGAVASAPLPTPPTSKSGGAPAPAPPHAGARYLLVGDSLAEGVRPHLATLARRAGVLFWGEGVRGATIRHWLGGSALTHAIGAASDPTMALVCLGTNDMRLADPAAEGHRAGELLAALRRNGVAVRWIAPPRMPFDSAVFRAALESECAAAGVRIFDSAALVPSLERAPDRVHLAPGGYKAWADGLARWVPFMDPGAREAATPHPLLAEPATSPTPTRPAPKAAPTPLPSLARVSGTTLPPSRPQALGEGRSRIDPRTTLGERAAQFALEEQRAGVREEPPGSNRGPRIDAYRRGLGAPGDPWCGFGFCYSAYAVLQPGEQLPHAYTGRVAEIVRTGLFHRRDELGYEPQVGDGAVFLRDGQDPTAGGNGHIGRVLVIPNAAGRFETVEANSGDAWAKREHRVDEPGFLGWIAYPQGKGALESTSLKPASLPASIVVEDIGALPFEEYVARVVTGELGSSREPQALAASAMAARTYAVWMLRHGGFGTEAKPMPNSTQKQVVAGAMTRLSAEATRATRGGLILYKHAPILASHNAGALWPRGARTGASGRDETHTEKNITYNRGLTGRSVRPTPIASAAVEGNRGCLSQNGADELARQGYLWPDICRYFYGRDVEFSIAEPGTRPSAKARPEPSGGDLLPLIAALGVGYRFLG